MTEPSLIRYGPDPSQEGDLYVPDGEGPHPVVVLIHGGFWRARWTRELMDPLARDLSSSGLAVWNIEYRRVGADGGWPETFCDIAAAVDFLNPVAERYGLDVGRVVAIGHSAGGHLAGWLGVRARYGCEPELGGDPVVRPRAIVGLAPVLDLVEAESRGLGGHAAADFLGGTPETVPERYATASVAARLPLGIPQVVVHGAGDDTVPLKMSEAFVAAAIAAGDDARIIAPRHADHFSLIDPESRDWAVARQALMPLLRRGAVRSAPG
jgi:acetyl esterase/lipase